MIGLVDGVLRVVAPRSVEASPLLAVPGDVALRRSRLIPLLGGYLSGMGRPAAAVTLGRTILFHPSVEPGARLLRHELAHVEQWRRHPFTFPFRYTAAHIRFGYRNNPFEIEARAAERHGPPGDPS